MDADASAGMTAFTIAEIAGQAGEIILDIFGLARMEECHHSGRWHEKNLLNRDLGKCSYLDCDCPGFVKRYNLP